MKGQRGIFLRWLILFGLTGFGVLLAWEYGYVTLLIESDHSRISLVILAVFALTSLHLAVRAWSLSGEQDRIRKMLLEPDSGSEARVSLGPLSRLLADTRGEHYDERHAALLIESLNRHFKAPNETGWFIADLLFKLGLIGTVVGFVLMLGSITNLEEVDITTIQNVLYQMSDGMRIALFTTLAGLTSGALLGMQCQLLDRGADDVIADASALLFQRIGHCKGPQAG
ncbi:MAG: MotA/TolQ/ExbB proton channel family protein [Gammaproteobacteria bacterium]